MWTYHFLPLPAPLFLRHHSSCCHPQNPENGSRSHHCHCYCGKGRQRRWWWRALTAKSCSTQNVSCRIVSSRHVPKREQGTGFGHVTQLRASSPSTVILSQISPMSLYMQKAIRPSGTSSTGARASESSECSGREHFFPKSKITTGVGDDISAPLTVESARVLFLPTVRSRLPRPQISFFLFAQCHYRCKKQ